MSSTLLSRFLKLFNIVQDALSNVNSWTHACLLYDERHKAKYCMLEWNCAWFFTSPSCSLSLSLSHCIKHTTLILIKWARDQLFGTDIVDLKMSCISPLYFTALIYYTEASNTNIQSYRSFQTRHLVVDLGVRLLHYEVRWWLCFTFVKKIHSCGRKISLNYLKYLFKIYM